MSSIKQQVQAQLDGFVTQGGGPFVLSVPGTQGTLQADLLVVDQLACSFEKMEFSTDALADASSSELQAVSEDLVARMTYLLEPLGVLELDEESASIQLRSVPPAKENGVIRYYELVVRRGGAITLQRYEKAQGQSSARRVIPAEVTRDVFQRLATDMEAALQHD